MVAGQGSSTTLNSRPGKGPTGWRRGIEVRGPFPERPSPKRCQCSSRYRDPDPMTFISYAQNYEDIMLFRALRHVADGFYVDVGANSPDEHSVTKAFYERGWRGINIEPVMEYH